MKAKVKRQKAKFAFNLCDSGCCLQRLIFFCAFCLLFAKISFAQDLETLAAQIRTGSTEQKRSALFQIRNLESAEASRIAVPALQDDEEIVRATAAASVVFLPKDEAAKALLPLLNDKSEFVRRETVYALGKIGSETATEKLIQTLQKDKKPSVKDAAAVALGQIGDVSAIEVLTQVLRKQPKPDEEFLHRSAARSIGQIAQILQINKIRVNTPTSFLPEKYKEIEPEKYQNLSKKFPQFGRTVPILVRILQNPQASGDVKREAAFALGAIADRSALPVLQTNLHNSDYYLAEICREAIKKIPTVNIVE